MNDTFLCCICGVSRYRHDVVGLPEIIAEESVPEWKEAIGEDIHARVFRQENPLVCVEHFDDTQFDARGETKAWKPPLKIPDDEREFIENFFHDHGYSKLCKNIKERTGGRISLDNVYCSVCSAEVQRKDMVIHAADHCPRQVSITQSPCRRHQPRKKPGPAKNFEAQVELGKVNIRDISDCADCNSRHRRQKQESIKTQAAVCFPLFTFRYIRETTASTVKTRIIGIVSANYMRTRFRLRGPLSRVPGGDLDDPSNEYNSKKYTAKMSYAKVVDHVFNNQMEEKKPDAAGLLEEKPCSSALSLNSTDAEKKPEGTLELHTDAVVKEEVESPTKQTEMSTEKKPELVALLPANPETKPEVLPKIQIPTKRMPVVNPKKRSNNSSQDTDANGKPLYFPVKVRKIMRLPQQRHEGRSVMVEAEEKKPETMTPNEPTTSNTALKEPKTEATPLTAPIPPKTPMVARAAVGLQTPMTLKGSVTLMTPKNSITANTLKAPVALNTPITLKTPIILNTSMTSKPTTTLSTQTTQMTPVTLKTPFVLKTTTTTTSSKTPGNTLIILPLREEKPEGLLNQPTTSVTQRIVEEVKPEKISNFKLLVGPKLEILLKNREKSIKREEENVEEEQTSFGDNIRQKAWPPANTRPDPSTDPRNGIINDDESMEIYWLSGPIKLRKIILERFSHSMHPTAREMLELAENTKSKYRIIFANYENLRKHHHVRCDAEDNCERIKKYFEQEMVKIVDMPFREDIGDILDDEFEKHCRTGANFTVGHVHVFVEMTGLHPKTIRSKYSSVRQRFMDSARQKTFVPKMRPSMRALSEEEKNSILAKEFENDPFPNPQKYIELAKHLDLKYEVVQKFYTMNRIRHAKEVGMYDDVVILSKEKYDYLWAVARKPRVINYDERIKISIRLGVSYNTVCYWLDKYVIEVHDETHGNGSVKKMNRFQF